MIDHPPDGADAAWDLRPGPRESPVVRLCALALAEGLLTGASAIRFGASDPDKGQVEYQVDGEWRRVMEIPLAPFKVIIERLKVMGGQAGRFRAALAGAEHDLSLSIEGGEPAGEVVTVSRR